MSQTLFNKKGTHVR